MAEARRCKAVRDYVAKNDDELTFKEGDVIYVPKISKDEFLTGVFNGKVYEYFGSVLLLCYCFYRSSKANLVIIKYKSTLNYCDIKNLTIIMNKLDCD